MRKARCGPRMLSVQSDLRSVRLASFIQKPQMSAMARQTVQDGSAHRIFAPTSTPISAHLLSKREIGAVITSKHAAPVKSPSLIKVRVQVDRACRKECRMFPSKLPKRRYALVITADCTVSWLNLVVGASICKRTAPLTQPLLWCRNLLSLNPRLKSLGSCLTAPETALLWVVTEGKQACYAQCRPLLSNSSLATL